MRGIELIAEVARRLEEAARSDHRVLIYLANECVQRGIFKSILDHFAAIRRNPRILLAYRERDDPMTRMMIGEMRDISFSEVNYDDVEKFLGTTWDAVIMDVNRQMRPN
ncbi:MAG: tRNA(Met) cytidine acetyltransferase TmcA domain-containing protein, partial [Nitrososphaerota archaeon]